VQQRVVVDRRCVAWYGRTAVLLLREEVGVVSVLPQEDDVRVQHSCAGDVVRALSSSEAAREVEPHGAPDESAEAAEAVSALERSGVPLVAAGRGALVTRHHCERPFDLHRSAQAPEQRSGVRRAAL